MTTAILETKRNILNHQDKEGHRWQEATALTALQESAIVSPPTKKVEACPTIMTANENVPFDVATTLTFDAVEYWAKVDPHRTALIYADKQWKVDQGKLKEKTTTKRKSQSSSDSDWLVSNPSVWKTITYREFHDNVNRFRAALHQAGVPLPSKQRKAGDFRILLLYAPPSRADVLALLIALQAAGCVLLFGTPDAFGGIRNWAEAMLKLKPDAVLANRTVYAIFRSIAMTVSSKIIKNLKKPCWFKSSILSKIAPKLSDDQIAQRAATETAKSKGVSLDSVTAIMFSSGTTGPPTPIEVTQRMLCFQAAGYAKLLQRHYGANVIMSKVDESDPIHRSNLTTANTAEQHCYGPWISTHIFVNFVMLDLSLGGTAVMQPMGLSCPDKTVCAKTLYQIWNHFGTQVTSAPPALWKRALEIQKQQRQNKASGGGGEDATCVDTLKIAFVGGAETTTHFARELSREFMLNSDHDDEAAKNISGGLYRVYGTTQVLPIATASVIAIIRDEDANSYCATGLGVCLGCKDDGLEVSIDAAAWKDKGGKTQFESPLHSGLELGELCVTGTAVSSSMEVVGKDSVDATPMRRFHTGDICFIQPETRHVYFLGRMAQAVYCGEPLKLVPPVGVEMVCLETQVVQHCAFVGAPHRTTGSVIPTLVAQLDQSKKEDVDMEVLTMTLRQALERSVWSSILNVGLRLVVYPKHWPVDSRHSSKTNRFLLRDWAAKVELCKFHSI